MINGVIKIFAFPADDDIEQLHGGDDSKVALVENAFKNMCSIFSI